MGHGNYFKNKCLQIIFLLNKRYSFKRIIIYIIFLLWNYRTHLEIVDRHRLLLYMVINRLFLNVVLWVIKTLCGLEWGVIIIRIVNSSD
jgi:hypothetical protein